MIQSAKVSISCLLDKNRDICSKCLKKDVKNDEVQCCDNCPRVIHIKCLSKRKKSTDDKWYCQHCRLNVPLQADFQLLQKHCLKRYLELGYDYDSDFEETSGVPSVYKNYLNLFETSFTDSKEQEDDISDRRPSLGVLILHFEALMDSASIGLLSHKCREHWLVEKKSPRNLYSFLSEQKRANDTEYQIFVHFLKLYVSKTMGQEAFCQQFITLVAATQQHPPALLGLAPAISLFYRRCPNRLCQEFRYFHRFCFKCGQIFNAFDDFKRDSCIKAAMYPTAKSSTTMKIDDIVYGEETLHSYFEINESSSVHMHSDSDSSQSRNKRKASKNHKVSKFNSCTKTDFTFSEKDMAILRGNLLFIRR